MTTTIQNLDDLQDRRIMMDRDVPPYGYAFVILVGLFMIFLLVWSTRTNRIYVSQNSGTVQASNIDKSQKAHTVLEIEIGAVGGEEDAQHFQRAAAGR